MHSERVALAAERFLVRLEQLGAAVHPIEPGRAMFEVEPLLLMHGGRDSLFARVREMYSAPDLRLGLGPNPFVAWVAAQHAHAGGHVAITAVEAPRVLADMPLDLVPADDRTLRLLNALGLRTLGEFASIDRDHITDRLGAEGAQLHALARGDDDTALSPRIPVDPIEEYLNFPEPLAASDVLGRALNVLLERALSHPRCLQYAPRAVVVVATLVPPSPGLPAPTYRVRRVLRVPTVDLVRVHTASLPALAAIPAPVDRLMVRLEEFEPRTATQQSLLGRNTSITGGDSVGCGGIDDRRARASRLAPGTGSSGRRRAVAGARAQRRLAHARASRGARAAPYCRRRSWGRQEMSNCRMNGIGAGANVEVGEVKHEHSSSQ